MGLFDAFKNFARSTLASGINNSVTALTVATGDGAKFPAVPFNATIWNLTDYATPDLDPNVEIVRVTALSGDSFSTIVRAQESTSAANHNTGGKTYGILAGVTSRTMNLLPKIGYRFITTTATITADDTLVVYDTSGGAFTATLPAANSVVPGHTLFFTGYGASGTAVLTVSAAGADKIRTGGASGSSSESTTDVMIVANRQQSYRSDGVSKWYKS